MRRSICTCEPAVAYAGEFNTWRFKYTTASNLPSGTLLEFTTGSTARSIDWEPPTADIKVGENVIYAHLEDGKVIQGEEVEHPDEILPRYRFTLPSALKSGETVTIVMGAPKTKEKKSKKIEIQNQAQTYTQRRRPFFLYIDPKGKGRFGDPEVFTIDVKGNKLHTINIITPSIVCKNKRFDVIIRFEDEFGNLTSNIEDENTLIELTHENIRENLNWKLFVPETGFISLPNLYFNEPGVYTIKLKYGETEELFQSPPILCFSGDEDSLFWGLLHGESEKVDSTENIENCLRHFRDEKALNFFGTSPFEGKDETPNEIWKLISQNIPEFNEEDRFTTFLGFQWVGAPGAEGVRNFVFPKDQKQILRQKDTKYSTLKKIYKSMAPKELISIPTFTMGKGYHYDFKNFDPQFERVVEIYNSWGSSEVPEKEGSSCPIKPTKKKGISEAPEGSVQTALNENHRFGFVAGGLDDRGIYHGLYDNEQTQYPPGLTGILAKNHTREALFEALYNRSCYATTGERIIISFNIAGHKMGSELDTSEMQGLLVNRHISGTVAGTAEVHKIEIIRNGSVIHTIEPEGYHIDYQFDDLTPLEEHVIKPKDKNPPFVYYYLRVVQEDGHLGWSSPIWIDSVPPAKREQRKTKLKNAPKVEKEEAEDDEE